MHVDRISMELHILYLKGLLVKTLYKNDVFLSLVIGVILSNSADPDETKK